MLLALTLLISTLTLGTGRPTLLQGAVHLSLLATYLFLSFVALIHPGFAYAASCVRDAQASRHAAAQPTRCRSIQSRNFRRAIA